MKSNKQITGNSTLTNEKKRYKRLYTCEYVYYWAAIPFFTHARTHGYNSMKNTQTHANFHVSNNSFLIVCFIRYIGLKFYFINGRSIQLNWFWSRCRCGANAFSQIQALTTHKRETEKKYCKFVVCQLHRQSIQNPRIKLKLNWYRALVVIFHRQNYNDLANSRGTAVYVFIENFEGAVKKELCGIFNEFSLWRDKLFTNETLYDRIIYVIVLIYLINCVRCFWFFKRFRFLLIFLFLFFCSLYAP